MRRSTILIGTASVMAFGLSLTGCSNNPSGSSSDKTITMLASTDYQDGYDAIIADFEAANPGVTVNVTYGTGNDFESTENTQLAGGNAPDLLAVQPGMGGNLTSMGTFVTSGYLLDLSDREWASQIPDSIKALTDIDGKTYIYPGVLQPLGAFYNTQALADAGLDAPQTWSDLLTFCGDALDQSKVAFSLGLSDQWVAQLVPYSLASTLVYGQDSDWNAKLVSGDVTFPDSEWLAVEKQYMQMRDAGCFSEDPNGISFDNTLPPVANGDALAIVQVGGVFANLQDQNPDASYELQPLPATDDASQTMFAGSPGIAVGVNAATTQKDLALKFVDFLAQPENVNDLAESLGGAVPAISNADFQPSDLLSTFNELAGEGKVSPFPDSGWPNAAIQNAHLIGIQNMFLDKAAPTDVLDDMQAEVK